MAKTSSEAADDIRAMFSTLPLRYDVRATRVDTIAVSNGDRGFILFAREGEFNPNIYLVHAQHGFDSLLEKNKD
jgi:hypothetical protein